MGNSLSSSAAATRFVVASNDFQLVIEASKELEHLLGTHFGADGRGLHERISTAAHQLPPPTVRTLRFVASVRNALVHDHRVTRLEDRALFERRLATVLEELHVLIAKKQLDARSNGAQASSDACCLM
ncbi:hypothetical protein PybrP1_010957 [[Pythium] brassicae (nom. inval.)]|nr:hypothetical protein PybrP1_010957 [[Pythium] brassicae (nom. inval.)]